jgi:hypothetical protein
MYGVLKLDLRSSFCCDQIIRIIRYFKLQLSYLKNWHLRLVSGMFSLKINLRNLFFLIFSRTREAALGETN